MKHRYNKLILALALGIALLALPLPARAAPALSITTVSLPAGTVGVPYSAQVSAVGDGPVTFSIYFNPGGPNDFPAALQFSSGGVISGTPEVAGSFSFYVAAMDDMDETQKKLTLVIQPAPTAAPTASPTTVPSPTAAPTVTPASTPALTDTAAPQATEPPPQIAAGLTLPQGEAGTPYLFTFDAGSPDARFSLADGDALPPGLALDEGGALSGTPEQAGAYTFNVLAQTGGGQASQRASLLILEGAAPAVAPGRTLLLAGLALALGLLLAAVVVIIVLLARRGK